MSWKNCVLELEVTDVILLKFYIYLKFSQVQDSFNIVGNSSAFQNVYILIELLSYSILQSIPVKLYTLNAYHLKKLHVTGSFCTGYHKKLNVTGKFLYTLTGYHLKKLHGTGKFLYLEPWMIIILRTCMLLESYCIPWMHSFCLHCTLSMHCTLSPL